VDRRQIVSYIPIRIEVGEGLGSVRVYFSRRM
jgi:hypothetical protein